ncbi:MAG: hypothetical protein LBT97_00925 [Planctomycetota bacterium]|nr:hypothetical protein [Planctomycetota bacterium]
MTEADFDIAAFEKILADSEVSPIRFSVIMPKISLATMEIIGLDLGEQLDSFPSAVKPSAVEVELVKSNWEKIQEAYLATRGEAGE